MAKINEKAPDGAPDAPIEEQAEVVISQWEFIGTPPTRDDVIRLLGTLRPVHGVKTVDYADYVQALPQKKRIKKPHPTNPNLMVDEMIEAWVLYMSVAGRMKMLEEAAATNGWQVDFEPEPVTPTGVPGMIQMGDGRIVYREYVTIDLAPDLYPADNGEGVIVPTTMSVGQVEGKKIRVGRRPGTAWVPHSGGSAAAGSNPYEKVETSARGRALGAWGFGVFPGSGVASLEEMQGAASNARAMQAEQNGSGRQSARRQQRPSRDELLSKARSITEEFRQHRGVSEEQINQEMHRYLAGIGVKDPRLEDGDVNWEAAHDGQLQLTINKISEHLSELFAQQWTGQDGA